MLKCKNIKNNVCSLNSEYDLETELLMNDIKNILLDFNKELMLEEHKAAKLNPEKHRLSSTFPNGFNYYTWYVCDKHNKKGKVIESHSWCRSTKKNSAGYFLIWYQIQNHIDKTTKRTNFKAEKLRNDADDFCKRMQESKRFLKKNELIENYKQTF